MKFAGGLVQHLGLQMYGGAVPAIAELIANAWDADAPVVDVTVPLDQAITDELEIRVVDTGNGMTFDEVDNAYLWVGRSKRKVTGALSSGGRPVLGRKGIGKLAGFGIAQEVEVWTVSRGHLTAFSMRYDDITRHGEAAMAELYEPTILHDRSVTKRDPIQKGTLVVLKHLQVHNAIAGDRFRQGMSRRFSILSSQFKVVINGKPLTKERIDFQYRFPDKGWNDADVPGVGTIRWWAGFTKLPIAIEEARGIAVLARGKLAQAPFYFQMSGGTQGQHGLQYLTGEVIADALDDEADLIATDRASVLWENARAAPLLEWGQKTLRELLRQWSRKRAEDNVRRVRDTGRFESQIQRFPQRERTELRAAIEKLAQIDTIDDRRLDELVAILIRAYENDVFMSVIRALNAADVEVQGALSELLSEWDVLEAVSTAQLVRGRVEVIRKFRELIQARVPEKPDMQDFVAGHPWLLDIRYEPMCHETSLDRILMEHFQGEAAAREYFDHGDGAKRPDFLCMADSGSIVVVELKRPGDLIGLSELGQVESYVDYLREWCQQSTGSIGYRTVQGYLIYSRLRPDAEQKKRRLERDNIYVHTWDALLQTAERSHREFLAVVKSRAPQDDPRITNLPEISQ